MDTRPARQVLKYLRELTLPVEHNPLDAELIERFVQAHDGSAFARLMERHGPLVLAVSRRVLHNHHDAEDVFQATFLVLARKAQFIRRREALASWLYKVAYRLAVKLRAELKRQRLGDLLTLSSQPKATYSQTAWSELCQALDEEVDRLPEKYRTPLVMCCLRGRTRKEAADRLGWTLSALKMRLERGRLLLRTRLARRGLAILVFLTVLMLVPRSSTTVTAKDSALFAQRKPSMVFSVPNNLFDSGLSTRASDCVPPTTVVALNIFFVAVGMVVFSCTPKLPSLSRDARAADDAARSAQHSAEATARQTTPRQQGACVPGLQTGKPSRVGRENVGSLELYRSLARCSSPVFRCDQSVQFTTSTVVISVQTPFSRAHMAEPFLAS